MSPRLQSGISIGLALLLIALATLVPLPGAPLQPVRGLEPADLLVNLCLFAPLGWLLRRSGWSWAAITLSAAGLSAAVEVLQNFLPGRRGTPADVFANAVGAFLGAFSQQAWARISRPPVRPANRGLVAAVVSLPVLVWLISGPLLAAGLPSTPTWWGQWSHRFSWTEPFRGTIQTARLQSLPAPDGPLDDTPGLRSRAAEEGLDFSLTFLSGGPTTGLTHLASVAGGAGGFVIGVEQLGSDLLVSWRSRGAALGFRAPRMSIREALDAEAGQPVEVQATLRGLRLTVRVRDPAGEVTHRILLTPLAGWRNLIPTRGLGPGSQRGFDAVWGLGCLAYLLVALRGLRRLAVR